MNVRDACSAVPDATYHESGTSCSRLPSPYQSMPSLRSTGAAADPTAQQPTGTPVPPAHTRGTHGAAGCPPAAVALPTAPRFLPEGGFPRFLVTGYFARGLTQDEQLELDIHDLREKKLLAHLTVYSRQTSGLATAAEKALLKALEKHGRPSRDPPPEIGGAPF